MSNEIGNDYDINLYYQTVVSSIREQQVKYLRAQKALPFTQDLPEVQELSPGEYAQLGFWAKLSYKRQLKKQRKAYNKALRQQKRPVNDDLTYGYNAGIEMALKVLAGEHKEYCKLMEKEAP